MERNCVVDDDNEKSSSIEIEGDVVKDGRY
jgi:hypothetical protein